MTDPLQLARTMSELRESTDPLRLAEREVLRAGVQWKYALTTYDPMSSEYRTAKRALQDALDAYTYLKDKVKR